MSERPPIPEVPAPYLALMAFVRGKYGPELAEELHAVYTEASRRSQRAARLAQFERDLLRLYERARRLAAGGAARASLQEQIAYRVAALSDPQAYIDGRLDDPPQGNKIKRPE